MTTREETKRTEKKEEKKKEKKDNSILKVVCIYIGDVMEKNINYPFKSYAISIEFDAKFQTDWT